MQTYTKYIIKKYAIWGSLIKLKMRFEDQGCVTRQKRIQIKPPSKCSNGTCIVCTNSNMMLNSKILSNNKIVKTNSFSKSINPEMKIMEGRNIIPQTGQEISL